MSRNRGLTLAELILAIGVIGVASAMALGITHRAQHTATALDTRELATSIADGTIERVRLWEPAALPIGIEKLLPLPTVAEKLPAAQLRVCVYAWESDPTLRHVVVGLSWGDGEVRREVVREALMSDHRGRP
jgi:prepilin-type N-terminal cleavage/methylation domain-containing protein